MKSFSLITKYYDRIIAGVILILLAGSLAGFAVRASVASREETAFDRMLDSKVPAHPEAVKMDTAVRDKVFSSFGNPFRVNTEVWEEGSVRLFVPESRVSCVDCRKPIPYYARECIFCSREQPEDSAPVQDFDGDGILDEWELKHRLNPRDAADAVVDSDGDGFTNKEEFNAGTDPRDPSAHPTGEEKLVLKQVRRNPFPLLFKSVMTMPDGSLKFAVNIRDNRRTYFVKLGDVIEDFVVEKFEKKSQQRRTNVGNVSVDVSVLTLVKEGKSIDLIRGEAIQYDEYHGMIYSPLDGRDIVFKMNDKFTIRNQKYEVIRIDISPDAVVIRRDSDRRVFTVLPVSSRAEDVSGAEDVKGEFTE